MKKPTDLLRSVGLDSGRGERIRTSGLYVPNVALYQAKLHPEVEPEIVANLGARFDGGLKRRFPPTVLGPCAWE